MDIKEEPTYWQVATGFFQRRYPEIFIDFGVFATDSEYNNGHDKKLSEVKKGDIFILKGGISYVHAVGIVQDESNNTRDYYFNLDGWQLDTFRKVEWYKAPDASIKQKALNLAEGTIRKTSSQNLITFANEGISRWKRSIPQRKFIEDIRKLENKEIVDELYNSSKTIQAEYLAATLVKINELANVYNRINKDMRISESQIKTFLVIPLLLALGWDEHNIALEYSVSGGRIDVVGFDKPLYDFSRNPRLLIETKKISAGLFYAVDQAQKYMASLSSIKTICVTNGYCYQIYDQLSLEKKKPRAYINLLEPLNRYPLDEEVEGGITALKSLLP